MLMKLIPGRDGCVDQQIFLFSNFFYRTRLNLIKYYDIFCYITVISKCNWNIYSQASYTTTTLVTTKWWPLLTIGRYTEVIYIVKVQFGTTK
jgi:hypothetical protein